MKCCPPRAGPLAQNLLSIYFASTLNMHSHLYALPGVAIVSWIIWAVFVRSYFSTFRHLPRAPQRNVFARLHCEPSTFEIERWMRNVPNDGFLRYFGFLNQERLLLTTPQLMRHVLMRDAGSYSKLPAIGAVQVPAGVSGLVNAEGALHKVCIMVVFGGDVEAKQGRCIGGIRLVLSRVLPCDHFTRSCGNKYVALPTTSRRTWK